MKKIIVFVAIIVTSVSTGLSQNVYNADYTSGDTANYPYWIEMMQDPAVNVFQTVEAFNKYWQFRPERKASGYNPFKRWEWYMMHKINPDGSRLKPDHDQEAFNNYVLANRSVSDFAGDWVNIGPVKLPDSPNPFWGNGRINAIAFHPTDADIFYIGAPSGGLWKTSDGGENWEPLTDDQPTLGVSSIVVDYDDPDIIYIGTGDRDAGDAAGLGIYKSIDGGENWLEINEGLNNATVGRMVQHPAMPDVIIAATSGGIYKTEDAGVTWVRKNNGSSKDILFKPGDPSVLYAISGSRFFRSTDSGETWVRIFTGLPTGAARAVIGVSEDNPEYVYYFATTNAEFYGLYRSTDGGTSFQLKSNSPNIMGWSCSGGSGGQAWYDLDMAVDPLDAETIYGGGINCWKSTNGGVSWVMSSNQVGDCGAYPVHADLHVLEYNPVDGRLYVGNDGGIWWTNNGGSSWNRITDGLAIGQQYKLGQSKLVANHVTTGYQDNGISTFHTDTWIQSDMYADGMESAMDYADTTLGYGCAQYGRMYRRKNDKSVKLIAGQGTGGINESGNWITPFCQHESDPNIMFAGYQNLWRTTNLLSNSPSWTRISSGTGSLNVVEHSPADVNVFYFATSGGLHRSDNINDQTPQFNNLSDRLPGSGAVFDIEAHPSNPDVVYIVQNQKVFKSTDKGLNWEDISGSLPSVSMNDIAFYDRSNIEGLYLGSNIGVFFKDENMDDWIIFSDGLPSALLVTEVEIFHHESDPAKDRIRVSSYGRGLWGSIPYYYQPQAGFESSETQLPTGCAIDFYDRSFGYPQSWSWTFEGATPNTSNEVNPAGIVYDQPGTYEVSLTVSNGEGSDTKTISGFIKVSDDMLPVVDFEAEETVQCEAGLIRFYDLSQACPESWEWLFSPDQVVFLEGTDKYSQNPVVEFNELGTYDVSLKVSNSAGENELVKEDYISIGGSFLPFYEDFEQESLEAKGWKVSNPDGSKTWDLTSIDGGGNQVVWMNFFDYTSTNARDYLTSPLLNFQGYESVFMTFKYAYAQRYFQKDSLIVNISDDCGETWTRIYANGPDGEGIFETSETTAEYFEPLTSDEWCGAGYGAECPVIDLGNWAGLANIKLQFESFANYGNNLYLTNVDISSTIGIDDPGSATADAFIFYPNPANTELNIVNLNNKPAELQIVDIHGRMLSHTRLENRRTKIDIGKLAEGIYFIKYVSPVGSITRKLIVR